MRFTAFVAFPLLFGFGMVAREFIVLAITDKWLESAVLIQMLCVSGAFMPLTTLLSNVVVSHGRSGTYFRATLALAVLGIVLMAVIWPWGIRAMVAGYVALNVVWTFVWQRLAGRLMGYSLMEFLADTMPYALAALAVMGVTWAATSSLMSLWLLLAARVVMAVVLYWLVMLAAHSEILDECMAYVFKKKKTTQNDK